MIGGIPMAQKQHDRRFPRGALYGAAALIGLALVSSGLARVSGVGRTHAPESVSVAARDLRFEDRSDGAVAIYEAASGRVVDMISPGTNGFLRGVMRGLARDRRQQHIGPEAPFRLTRWRDGRVSIEDSATHQRIELSSFGPTNAAAFARLLHDRSASK
jgi:putative photosynthetic complex assembly protein